MLLFQSLICLRGYDNGRRFLLISLVSYALLLLFSPVMSKAMVLTVLLLLVCTPILFASSMRRIHDAGFATPLAIIPVVTFWICTLGIALIDHVASYSLMILALLVTGAMTTISNARVRRNRDYYWGYDGPVNLAGSSTQEVASYYQQRVEPTIMSDNQESSTNDAPVFSDDLVADTRAATQAKSDIPPDWENKLASWFEGNRQAVMIAHWCSLALVLIVVAIWPLLTPQPEIDNNPVENKPVEEPKAAYR